MNTDIEAQDLSIAQLVDKLVHCMQAATKTEIREAFTALRDRAANPATRRMERAFYGTVAEAVRDWMA